MRYALMTEPQQGLSYDEILAVARAAEAAGIEAFFRSDHYASFPGGEGNPTTDAWATLAGLARETTTIRLGVLVSPVTFRIPGNLAKVVQTVDEMSGGRIEAGFGAGGTRTSTTSSGSRSRRSGSATTCSRSRWRSSTACGPSRTAGPSRVIIGGSMARSATARSHAADGAIHTSCSAARAARGWPRWWRAMATSSTSTPPRPTTRRPPTPGSARPAMRWGVTPARSSTRR